jgi:thiol-disulfide isomerase/thioredoxin
MPAEVFDSVKKHMSFLTSNDGMLYYNYVLMYLTSVPNKGHKDNTAVSRTSRTIKMLDSIFATAKSDFLKIRLTDKDPNERKKILELVLANVKTDWCQKVIKDQYNQNEEKLKSINGLLSNSKPITSANPLGKPIAELNFGATLYKVDSMDAKTLLSNLKNSFPNKALLLDMWATWCAPCIAEFPHSKKLNESTKDLPVEFVYLCTSEGSSIEKWKTKIAEFELRGTHIYVAKNIENKLLEMFSGGGFPTYAFINRNGEYKPGAIERVSTLNKEKLAALIK